MNKNGRVFIFLLLIFICCIFLASASAAGDNDPRFDSYTNMNAQNGSHSKYTVPNLFREDAPYTNVKSFPLVVKDGVEYVPLDIFNYFSYLKVVYSKMAYGFYITNTSSGKYILFDLEQNITSTHNGTDVDIHARLFNQTHYLPARAVCGILGLSFETYDNTEQKIFAARVFDQKAKYTTSELVAAYSPQKKPSSSLSSADGSLSDGISLGNLTDGAASSDAEADIIIPTLPQQGGNSSVEQAVRVGRKTVRLIFTGDGNTSAVTSIINTLRKKNITAVFLLRTAALDAAALRALLCDGHIVGFIPQDTSDVLADVQNANAFCYLATKRKLHTVYVTGDTEKQLFTDNGYAVFAEKFTDMTSTHRTASAVYQNAAGYIFDSASPTDTDCVLSFDITGATASAIEKLLNNAADYPHVRFISTTE